MSLKLSCAVALCLLFPSISLEAAQLTLREGGAQANGDREWLVLLQPDSLSSVAVEIGFQFTGGAILELHPNTSVFDHLNPGQNPFTGSDTIGTSIHNAGASAFASLGGFIPEVLETLVLTIVTDGPGTLALGGQNHNGYFTGARVWQGTSAVDGLAASLQVAGEDADFDLDGDVDGADFLRWQRGLGISPGAMRSDGDANADGTVDGADLQTWRGQFGPSFVAAAVAIPEPKANICILLAAAMLVRLMASSMKRL